MTPANVCITVVSQVIRSQDLARLMFAAVLKQIHHPDVDIYPKITSEEGLLRVFQSRPPVAFDISGQLSGFSYY